MTKAAAPEPARAPSAIPRTGLGHMLRELLAFDRSQRIDMRSRLSQLYETHGPVVMQELGPFKMVNLFGPDANRYVLLDRGRIFSARKPWTAIMGRIFPNGLLLRDGALHRHHRSIMQQPFKRPALCDYLERMNPMIDEATSAWDADGPELCVFPAYKALTLDMAASIFLGVDLGPATRQMNRVFEDLVAASMSRVRLRIPGLEFYRGLKGREFMQDFLRDLVPKRRAGDGPDMFTRLCHAETETGESFSDDEIVDHLIFLMMAAHDTTTSTLSSLTYLLARHPEWQERLRDEGRALGRRAIEHDDLERLPLLGQVMKETLRLYPPLPIVPRTATAAFEFGGYEIPEGAMVIVSPIHTHYMAQWWTAPTAFDPDRFSPERAEDARHSHSWAPFGGGPHHCLGIRFAEIQVKAVTHQLLQRYRIRVPDGYQMPVQQAPISKPRDGLPVRLERLD